jgi:hypothetical protein
VSQEAEDHDSEGDSEAGVEKLDGGALGAVDSLSAEELRADDGAARCECAEELSQKKIDLVDEGYGADSLFAESRDHKDVGDADSDLKKLLNEERPDESPQLTVGEERPAVRGVVVLNVHDCGRKEYGMSYSVILR